MWLCAAFLYLAADVLNVLLQPDTQTFAYLSRIADEALRKRASDVANLSTPEAVRERQKTVRARLAEALRPWPNKTPLNPRVMGVLRRDGYRIEKIIFESSPKLFVTANLYVPERGSGPFPAVLGAAGHAAEGKSVEVYQHVWITLARRGFVVLAWDPIQQGERIDFLDANGRPRIGPGTQQHVMTGLPVLLTGDSLARYFVWDGIRALDYLLTRREVDPQRIAVAGNSGGGTHAAMLAALDPRVAVAISSCYMTTSAELWRGHGPADSEQIVPSFIAAGLDYADFALAAAPRLFLIESAIRDFFPISGARASYREAKRLYDLLGHPDRMGMFEYNDEHGWFQPRREAAYRWLEQMFLGRDAAPEEPGLKVESASELAVTLSGRAASLGGETVGSLNARRAQTVYSSRKPLRSANAAEIVARRLAINSSAPLIPEAEEVAVLAREGYSIRKLILNAPEGLRLPALLFEPAAKAGRRPAVVWFDTAGMATGVREIEKIVQSGEIVLAIDPRGFGELRNDPAKDPFTTHGLNKTSMRAILTGKTLIGLAVDDLRTASIYLASLPSVDAAQLRAAGTGRGHCRRPIPCCTRWSHPFGADARFSGVLPPIYSRRTAHRSRGYCGASCARGL